MVIEEIVNEGHLSCRTGRRSMFLLICRTGHVVYLTLADAGGVGVGDGEW